MYLRHCTETNITYGFLKLITLKYPSTFKSVISSWFMCLTKGWFLGMPLSQVAIEVEMYHIFIMKAREIRLYFFHLTKFANFVFWLCAETSMLQNSHLCRSKTTRFATSELNC